MKQFDLNAFQNHNEQLYKVYDHFDLKHIRERKFSNKNSGQILSDVLRRKHNIFPLPYSDFKIHDELDFITKDLKYIVGNLLLLRPHIVDTVVMQGRYFQNLEDRRYLMYASFGYQCLYNFWDRIGDLLYLYFETGLPEKKVNLSTVLNNLKPEIKATDQFQSLFKLYEDTVKPFLNERHQVVHYFQLECKHYWGNLEYSKSPTKAKELNEEKFGYADYLKEMLDKCAEGFELVLALIEVLPNKGFFKYKVDSDDIITEIVEVRNLYNVEETLLGEKVLDESFLIMEISGLIDLSSELITVFKIE